jgi:hypothetical protein
MSFKHATLQHAELVADIRTIQALFGASLPGNDDDLHACPELGGGLGVRNPLYDLPLGHSFLYPYGGAGVSVTRFALPESAGDPTSNADSNGTRLGLNLVSGLRFDHVAVPVARPLRPSRWRYFGGPRRSRCPADIAR